MTPVLLLDVDGVLNALVDGLPDTTIWPRWQRGDASADGMTWPIVFSLDVVEQLRDWHASGRVELQWLTTWGHSANGALRQLLGLPELVVAGTYDDSASGGKAGTTAVAHAAVAPSAPDPLSGQWWKYDAAQRVLAAYPGRLVIWVDDELHDPDGPFRNWALTQPDLHAVGPAPLTGLTPDDLAVIDRLLRKDDR